MTLVDSDEHDEAAGGAAAEQFRQAALEAVRAARAMLDAAEAVIRDPSTLDSVVRTVAGVARTATETVSGFAAGAASGRARRDEGETSGEAGDPPDDDGYQDITIG
jgi:hypothetical protein